MEEILDYLPDDSDFQPSYNISPSQETIVIFEHGLCTMKWGLIPSWSTDAKFASKCINARSETLTEKPSYRNLVQHRHCVIPMNGYYEWRTIGKDKDAYYVGSNDELLFALGLWDEWIQDDVSHFTFTIITREATEDLSFIHHRMPVFADAKMVNSWIEGSDYKSFMTGDEKLDYYPVSSYVNSVRNNDENCINKIAEQGDLF